jgi:hypothetical protein
MLTQGCSPIKLDAMLNQQPPFAHANSLVFSHIRLLRPGDRNYGKLLVIESSLTNVHLATDQGCTTRLEVWQLSCRSPQVENRGEYIFFRSFPFTVFACHGHISRLPTECCFRSINCSFSQLSFQQPQRSKILRLSSKADPSCRI